MNHDETNELIKKVLDGDLDCFEKVIDSYKVMVFGIISCRIPDRDVNDVAQETFVDVFKSLASYSQRGGFGAWMRSICMRRCCDYWRKHEKRNEVSQLGDFQHFKSILHELSGSSFEQAMHSNAACEMVNLLMGKLNAEDRTLIDMLYFQGMKLHEAAKVLNWGLAKCKVRSMRARHKMRRIVMENLDGEI